MATTWLDALRELDPELDLAPTAPGVTVADLLALHDRVDPPPGFRSERVAYATGEPERWLHLYAPAAPAAPRPGVLFVHGGGWQGGCPTWHLRQACALAEHGYVAATAAYRLAPGVRWPAPFVDVQQAFDWLNEHAAEIGLDPSRIVVAGASAGGHLAAMLAFTRPVAGAILWYPVVDLAEFSMTDAVIALMGDGATEEMLRAASPLAHVTKGCPAVLTLTGERDVVTPVDHVARLHHALDEAGVPNRLVVYPGRDHQFDLYPGGWQDSFAETLAFLADTVGEPPA